MSLVLCQVLEINNTNNISSVVSYVLFNIPLSLFEVSKTLFFFLNNCLIFNIICFLHPLTLY